MKKSLILLGLAAAMALPAAATEKKYFSMSQIRLPEGWVPAFLLEKPTPIDAEFTALVRQVEMGRVRSEKWASLDRLAMANEKQDLDDLRARLDRGPAMSKAEKNAAIEQARQAIRQRYAELKSQWRAPEPRPELLAAVAPVYASYYSLPRMRELNIAYSAPLDGKTTTIKRDALESFERVDKALAKARMAAFGRQLDLTRVETKPLP
ncbi:MAG: hypothetical protein V4723_18080 [Pseudomonadota bacterium]